MRPISLEMKAFGSYAEKTTVPFKDLNGLFLITGDTGAGKTTIFDAIMFALYGVPSGSERDANMLHCDRVPKSVPSEVEFVFLQDNKAYTVRRSLHYRRSRESGEYDIKGTQEAEISSASMTPVRGQKNVNNKCEEILGLNAEQFKKIIMLAQGEFREFLDSDSAGKSSILGKIFDTREYKHYQDVIAGVRDKIKKLRSDKIRDLDELMDKVFIMPENLDESERLQYNPGNSNFIENLENLTIKDKERLDEINKEAKAISDKMGSLNQKKGAAEGINDLFNELYEKKNKLDALKEQEEVQKNREEQLSLIENAHHNIEPLRKKLSEIEDKLKAAREDESRLKDEKREIESKLEEVKNASKEDERLNKEKESLALEIRRLSDCMGEYEHLTDANKELENLEKERREKNNSLEQLGIKIKECKDELSELNKKLEELGNSELALAEREKTHEDIQKLLNELDGEKGIKNAVKETLELEGKIANCKQERIGKSDLAKDAANDYNRLYQFFMAGQAGIIASDIRKELEKEGRAICPVCGSEIDKKDTHRLALLPEDTPTRDEVDKAKNRAEKADNEWKEIDTKIQGLENAAKVKKEEIERRAEILPDKPKWDTLSSEGYLRDLIAQKKIAESDAYSDLEKAQKLIKDREDELEKSGELEKALRGAEKQRDELNNELAPLNTKIATTEQSIEDIKKQIQYESEEEAKEQLIELERRKKEIETTLKQHSEDINKLENELSSVSGRLQQAEEITKGYNADRANTEKDLSLKIAENGFSGTDEVDSLLSIIDGDDSETWIKREQDSIKEYKNNVSKISERVEELKKNTEDKTPIDMESLESEIRDAKSKEEGASTLRNEQDKIYRNHQDVLEKAKEIKNELSKTESVWEKIERLGNIAVGVNAEGGKIDFERFVIGAIFGEVIDAANMRMQMLSGGRYELIHELSNQRSKASSAGLEINVLDNTSGVQRLSKSLSGGESFFTSLALALGLSDVVQNHAGGKKLEAIFIDEGFGSLSSDVLDKALEVLDQLTDGSRLVGIISHVERLEESIPQKIRVRAGENGSRLSVETV